MFGWLKKDPIRPEMVEALKGFLGSEGIKHFTKIYEKHGTLMAVEQHGRYPHAIHFREGMMVRNFLRSTGLCENWDAHDYDNRWEEVTLRACGYRK
jgi:hypothetical protein